MLTDIDFSLALRFYLTQNRWGCSDAHVNSGHTSSSPCKHTVEQDHPNIKHRIRPMQGSKSFRRAQTLLAGIELIHMIRKGQ
ncbi:TPA: DDE-type integrase/transposase/recombinase [Yersinia enterocolitica]